MGKKLPQLINKTLNSRTIKTITVAVMAGAISFSSHIARAADPPATQPVIRTVDINASLDLSAKTSPVPQSF
ncbi:MAG TPA: hypothetical protein VKJ65_14325, partial [Phycisphaerae bacterium]|nr:hypothetical protein [Phycisphaerae bacterium]